MTTADRHADVDPATVDGHRESRDYTDRNGGTGGYQASGYDAPPSGDERHLDQVDRPHDGGAQRLDAQDEDTRGVSDPTLTDAAATTAAEADPARTEHSHAGQQAGTADHGATAAGDGTPAAGAGSGERLERLVPSERVHEYTTRWDSVKGEFVDEPRQAVAKADALVGELLDELDQLFRKQRSDLEHGLDADETSTEELRLAMRRYRSFFDRLLAL